MIRTFVETYYQPIIFLLLLLLLIPVEPVIRLLELRLDGTFATILSAPWRLFTAHFIHANGWHLLLNLANILLLTIVFHRYFQQTQWIGFIFFSALFISLGLWLLSNLSSYVGFSGVFHGLLFYFLLTSIRDARQAKQKILLLTAIVLLVGKILYEQISGGGGYLSEMIDRSVAVDAHLLGLVSGLLFWFLECALTRHQYLSG